MGYATAVRAMIGVLAVAGLTACGSSGSGGSPADPGGASGGASGGALPGSIAGGESVGSSARGTSVTTSGSFDICGLATPGQVGTIVGSPVKIAETSGGTHCDYSSAERDALAPVFDDNTVSGYAQAKAGEAILGGQVRELSGVGDHAYVATGKFAGSNAATSAVEAGGHTVHVTVTSSTRTPAQLGVVAEKLVRVIAGNL